MLLLMQQSVDGDGVNCPTTYSSSKQTNETLASRFKGSTNYYLSVALNICTICYESSCCFYVRTSVFLLRSNDSLALRMYVQMATSMSLAATTRTLLLLLLPLFDVVVE